MYSFLFLQPKGWCGGGVGGRVQRTEVDLSLGFCSVLVEEKDFFFNTKRVPNNPYLKV